MSSEQSSSVNWYWNISTNYTSISETNELTTGNAVVSRGLWKWKYCTVWKQLQSIGETHTRVSPQRVVYVCDLRSFFAAFGFRDYCKWRVVFPDPSGKVIPIHDLHLYPGPLCKWHLVICIHDRRHCWSEHEVYSYDFHFSNFWDRGSEYSDCHGDRGIVVQWEHGIVCFREILPNEESHQVCETADTQEDSVEIHHIFDPYRCS